jgi:hypothetical protein
MFEVLSAIINTKYTDIPANPQSPLWQNATVTATVMLRALQKQQEFEAYTLSGNISQPILTTVSNMLNSGGLSDVNTNYSEAVLSKDESFDNEHFRMMHEAIVSIFQNDDNDGTICTRYAIILFNASLLAKPWFNDLPGDLEGRPLQGLMDLRPGSVHKPSFAVRRRICYTSVDALFDLVGATKDDDRHGCYRMSLAAAPYLLLRVVHTLKTFISDQRLRGLTPPPMPQQIELQVIITKLVDLRSDGEAMGVMHKDNRPVATDGKEHLRILYPMMLRIQRFWHRLPRLKDGGAWQDDEPGRAIEAALERWSVAIGEGWGL